MEGIGIYLVSGKNLQVPGKWKGFPSTWYMGKIYRYLVDGRNLQVPGAWKFVESTWCVEKYDTERGIPAKGGKQSFSVERLGLADRV